MLKWLWITAVVVIADQISKQLAEHTLIPYQAVTVFPSFFNINLMYNEGAAFSFLSDAGGWQRWFFLVLSILISVVLLIWLARLAHNQTRQAIALSLVLGGAIGNVIDRLLFGHVIDFIQVYYESWYWPTFNIADSAITIGAVILIIDSLFEGKQNTHNSDPTAPRSKTNNAN